MTTAVAWQQTGADIFESDASAPDEGSASVPTGGDVREERFWHMATQGGSISNLVVSGPITLEGDMVRIRPSALEVGKPEAFVYLGVSMLAIKQSAEVVDFYYVPAE